MRVIFGVLSLLVVVAIIGVLARKQLTSFSGAAPQPAAATAAGVTVPAGTPQQQVDQYQKAITGAMQQARPSVDEPK